MNTYRRFIQFSVMLVLCAGCASAGVEKRLEPGDLPSLAGKWQGWARGTAIGSRSVEMTIHPDGSFVSLTTGADQVQGRMAIIDGKAELRGKATGPTASPTSSTATLYERNGKRILSGEGRTPYGLYTYELEAVR